MRVTHRRPVFAALLGSLATLAILAGAALAANTIRSIDIVNGSITSADLRNSDVRSIDIRNGNVVTADIRTGAVTNTRLATGAVGSGKLADGSIASIDIADGAVASVDIADGGVASADIADGAVASVDIADGAVATADLADGSVSAGKLAPLEAWHVVGAAGEPAFEGGWGAYTSYAVRFRKDRDGYVHIDGLASRPLSGTVSTMFTLPEAYRPPLWHGFLVASTDPFMGAEDTGRILVRADGGVVVSPNTHDLAVFLDGIAFPTS